MRQIVVISGKGGTGKTVITASFASLAESKVMADCDVDAPDLHLLLHPRIRQTYQFKGGKTAIIDPQSCTGCGRCQEVCRFEAIIKQSPSFVIDPICCEGCGVCSHLCPERAISMEENLSGHWFISDTRYGPLVHARLGVAEGNSGKLVTVVRQNARLIAEKEGLDYVIIDGPPGIGCPVIASISGVDLALIVTEPTLSGVHDLERVTAVACHFGVKTAVCVNKFDLNLQVTESIVNFCRAAEIEVIGKLPYDTVVTRALVAGKPVVEYSDGGVSRQIKGQWERISEILRI